MPSYILIVGLLKYRIGHGLRVNWLAFYYTNAIFEIERMGKKPIRIFIGVVFRSKQLAA